MVQRYISHSISNTLHYSSEIHPYVGEFHYLCFDDAKVGMENAIFFRSKKKNQKKYKF